MDEHEGEGGRRGRLSLEGDPREERLLIWGHRRWPAWQGSEPVSLVCSFVFSLVSPKSSLGKTF